MKLNLVVCAALVLAACASQPSQTNKRPSFVNVPIPKTVAKTPLRYMSVHLAPSHDGKTVSSLYVTIEPGGTSKPSNRTAQVLADPQTAARVGLSFHDGRDQEAAMRLAQQVARATYCRSGPVTANTGIRRITRPEDLQAVLAESKRQGRDVVPAGVKGESVPAAHFRSDGTPRWNVWLNCSSAYPY